MFVEFSKLQNLSVSFRANCCIGILLISILIQSCDANCGNRIELNDTQLNGIISESRQVLSLLGMGESLEVYDRYPAIANIKPEKIFVGRDGVYIVLCEIFGEQKGIFVPINGLAVSETQGSDPFYRKIREGLYYFEIKG